MAMRHGGDGAGQHFGRQHPEQRGFGHRRGERVAGNPVARIAAGEVFGQSVQRGLAGAVVRRIEHVEIIGPVGRDIDDFPDPVARQHQRDRLLAAVKGRCEVDRHLPVKLSRRDMWKVGHEAGARIVDQRIEAAEAGFDHGKHAGNGRRIGQINGQGGELRPSQPVQPVRINIKPHDMQPVGQQPGDNRPTHAPGGPGHNCNFGHLPLIVVLAALEPGPHRSIQTHRALR